MISIVISWTGQNYLLITYMKMVEILNFKVVETTHFGK